MATGGRGGPNLLGHWNWRWNQARSSYSTYDQELLAGMLVLSLQSRLLGSNPIVWLCDQKPVKSVQKGVMASNSSSAASARVAVAIALRPVNTQEASNASCVNEV